MRRRSLIALVALAAMMLGSAAVFAVDSYVTTPHAKSGPHFHKLMVVRADLARGGGGGKPTPTDPSGPNKDIPVAEASMTSVKGQLGRAVPGNSVGVPVATPEQRLETSLRSIALGLR